jgi:hypothetical protein
VHVQVHVDVVEIDEAILQVAKEWFGFVEDARSKAFIADGLAFIREAAEKGARKSVNSRFLLLFVRWACFTRRLFFRVTTGDVDYDAVVFDVSNGESSSGVSAPPLPFLDDSVLSNVKKSLRDGG